MTNRLESSAENESYLPAIGSAIEWTAYTAEQLLRGGIVAAGGTIRGVTRVAQTAKEQYRKTIDTVYPAETNLNTPA